MLENVAASFIAVKNNPTMQSTNALSMESPQAEASRSKRLGVISDTHGLIRPEALELLAGCELIIHAGDIGKPDVLAELQAIAPVVAVRGNNDKGEWAKNLPETEVVEFAGLYLYVLHDLHELDLDPAAAGFRVVISGHSHRPEISHREEVLYLNPGSAGPRRFKLPNSLAFLEVVEGEPTARVELIQST
jgi:putative phosphoesterase